MAQSQRVWALQLGSNQQTSEMNIQREGIPPSTAHAAAGGAPTRNHKSLTQLLSSYDPTMTHKTKQKLESSAIYSPQILTHALQLRHEGSRWDQRSQKSHSSLKPPIRAKKGCREHKTFAGGKELCPLKNNLHPSENLVLILDLLNHSSWKDKLHNSKPVSAASAP